MEGPTIKEITANLSRLFKEKDGYLHTAVDLVTEAFTKPGGSPERISLMDQAQDALVWANSLEMQINQGIRELEKATAAAGWD